MRLFSALIFLFFLAAACKENKPDAVSSFLDFHLVENPALSGSEFPHLFSAGPDLYMSWIQNRADSSFLMYAKKTGDTWSKAEEVASGTDWFVNWADFPEVFMGKNGRIFSHHLAKTGKGTYAYGVEVSQKGSADAGFTDLGNPYTDTSETEHGFVSFLSLPKEGPAMVWLDGRKYATGVEEMSLRTAKIDEQGNFYDEGEIDTRTCDCCQTDATSTRSGAIVVYRDRSPDEVRDIYSSVYKDGAWSDPRPVASDNWEINGCPVNGPAVAAMEDEVAVAWFTAANDTPKVKVAFSHNGGEDFGQAIQVDIGNPMGRVDVLWADKHTLYVSWMERGADNEAKVMLRSLDPHGHLHKPQVVGDMSSERASGFPIMAKVQDKIYLAWTLDTEKPEVVLWEGRRR